MKKSENSRLHLLPSFLSTLVVLSCLWFLPSAVELFLSFSSSRSVSQQQPEASSPVVHVKPGVKYVCTNDSRLCVQPDVAFFRDCYFEGAVLKHDSLCYKKETREGGSRWLLSRNEDLGEEWDRAVSSIQVGKGWKVEVFRRKNFEGEKMVLTESAACLKNGWNDGVRSFKLFKWEGQWLEVKFESGGRIFQLMNAGSIQRRDFCRVPALGTCGKPDAPCNVSYIFDNNEF